MTQKSKKGVKIATFISAILIVSITACVFVIFSGADEDSFKKELYGDGTLQVGRYYMNGNMKSFYFEVFEDQTIQLAGGDLVEFALMFYEGEPSVLEDPKDPLHEETWNAIKNLAKFRGTRHDYVLTKITLPDAYGKPTSFVSILLEAKTIEEVIKNGGGRGLHYIDEKTIGISSDYPDMNFIRID